MVSTGVLFTLVVGVGPRRGTEGEAGGGSPASWLPRWAPSPLESNE